MLRAVRFAAQLGFEIEPATFAAVREHAPSVTEVSAERIRDELLKIFRPSHAALDWICCGRAAAGRGAAGVGGDNWLRTTAGVSSGGGCTAYWLMLSQLPEERTPA